MTTRVVDGIDIDSLSRMAGTFSERPDLARFRFRATNRWCDGTHNQAIIRGFYGAGGEDRSRQEDLIFDEDEPELLLGRNRGANPVEYVLIGLSGCLTTSLVANAAARGIELRSVESVLEGDLDVRGFLGLAPEVRNGYQAIRVTFRIAADAPDATLRDLVAIAQQRSPVYDVVTHGVPVTVRYERAA